MIAEHFVARALRLGAANSGSPHVDVTTLITPEAVALVRELEAALNNSASTPKVLDVRKDHECVYSNRSAPIRFALFPEGAVDENTNT